MQSAINQPGTTPAFAPLRGPPHHLRCRLVRLLCCLLFSLASCALLFILAWFVFPFPTSDLTHYPAATILLDRTGEPLRLRLGPHDTDCRLQYHPDPDKDWICRAVVAAEDQRFWHHAGVDPLALGRAVGQNIAQRRTVSGASTLTTQVIRLLHPRCRTLWTKGVELFRALQLEALRDKRAILEQYLNRAPFGANLVGIEAASRRYFAKEPQDLSLAEAALLAGLPQSPSRLRPDRFPARARHREVYVLDRMVVCGLITPAQRQAALATPVVLRTTAYPFRAPHFCEMVLDALASEAGGPGAPRTGGHSTARAAECAGHLRAEDELHPALVRTTLDPALQRLVEHTLRNHATEWRAQGVNGGAVVVIEIASGAVRALVGSPDYADASRAGQVNAASALRAPGSTFKPFVYALAMDQGRLTPATVLADVPRTFKDLTPVNFDGVFHGPVAAQAALTLSLNIPALTLTEQTGPEALLRMLRSAGLATLDKSPAHYGLSLVLGDAPVRLIDLVNAYACFGRGGVWQPYRVLEADDARAAECAGIVLTTRAAECAGHLPRTTRRVCSPEAAWLVAEMLGGDGRQPDSHRADVQTPRIAWKTGTSSGFHDAWAVAFNPVYAIGVWAGNPDGRAAPSLVGARIAVPVMWDIVRSLYLNGDAPWFAQPSGVARRAVCSISGLPAGPDCPQTEDALYIPGVTSPRPCDVHVRRTLPDGHAEIAEVWPPAVAAFLRARQAPETAATVSPDETPHLINPLPGAVYRRVEGLATAQSLAFKATCRNDQTLYWFVDDQFLAASAASTPVNWPLARGRHTVVCATAAGRSARADVVVE